MDSAILLILFICIYNTNNTYRQHSTAHRMYIYIQFKRYALFCFLWAFSLSLSPLTHTYTRTRSLFFVRLLLLLYSSFLSLHIFLFYRLCVFFFFHSHSGTAWIALRDMVQWNQINIFMLYFTFNWWLLPGLCTFRWCCCLKFHLKTWKTKCNTRYLLSIAFKRNSLVYKYCIEMHERIHW